MFVQDTEVMEKKKREVTEKVIERILSYQQALVDAGVEGLTLFDRESLGRCFLLTLVQRRDRLARLLEQHGVAV